MDPGLLILRGRSWNYTGAGMVISINFHKEMIVMLHINAFLVKDILINPEP